MIEITALIPILTTIIGFAVLWGKFTEKINVLSREIQAMEKRMTAKNGTPVYVTNREHTQVYKAITDDINEVKVAVSQLGEELRKQAIANAKEFSKISNFMGRVEQFLLEHGKNKV